MNKEEIVDNDENVDIEDKTPFSWKKVLLSPFKSVFHPAYSGWPVEYGEACGVEVARKSKYTTFFL